MGEGIYDGYPIVKANTDHVHYLQNNLRDSDVRECIIHGSTPFRALMSGIREKQAELIANGLGNPRATFVRFNGAY